MSDNGMDAKLLHDLIVASTQANESMKNSLKGISESMEALVESSVTAQEFIESIRAEKKTFYQYTVKTFMWVFLVLIMIIGALLWKLQVIGGKEVSGVASSLLGVSN